MRKSKLTKYDAANLIDLTLHYLLFNRKSTILQTPFCRFQSLIKHFYQRYKNKVVIFTLLCDIFRKKQDTIH